MVVETTHASNVEQVVILFKRVSESFEVAKELVGLDQVASSDAEIIYGVNTDVFKRLNLAISKIRGQNSGVATRLQRE